MVIAMRAHCNPLDIGTRDVRFLYIYIYIYIYIVLVSVDWDAGHLCAE